MRIADVDAFVKPREEWLKKERKKKHNEEYRRGYLEGAKVLLFELKSERFAPTADAEPVRHGHWIEKTNYIDTYYTCSSCGEDFCTIDGTPKDNGWNYCPNCGADMRGE